MIFSHMEMVKIQRYIILEFTVEEKKNPYKFHQRQE